MRKNIVIPAAVNGAPGVYTENVGESGFSVVSASASFQFWAGSNPAQSLASGMAVGSADGPSLGRVTFQNTSAADVNVTLGDYALARATTIAANASTFVGPNSGFYDFGNTPAPAGITFAGTDSSGRGRRVIYITNSGRTAIGGSSTAAVLGARASGGGSGISIIVQPGITQPIETDADITILAYAADLSTGPAHLAGSVLEVFYNKPLQTDQ